jgi:hypothetical protein
MYVAVIVVAVVLGGFILAPRFLGENEDATAFLDKIGVYQGIIGLIVVVFALLAFGSLIGAISLYDLYRISLMLTIFDIMALGFVLGYGLISEQVLSKSENASTKGTELNDRLQPRQELLGMAAIGLAVLTIVLRASL